ncbi:hypothetical protein MTR_5g029120 [Medicago truncatula]|uniref:Uncharacterized protein n=1 Tax=Medicago truncatula TaxID=3880 RepID=G7KCA8_MEDTR|nr:hypothetical protein MTR_5g029120 [Medicago truncatula]
MAEGMNCPIWNEEDGRYDSEKRLDNESHFVAEMQTANRTEPCGSVQKSSEFIRTKCGFFSLSVFALHPLYLRVHTLSENIPREIKAMFRNFTLY